MGTDMNALKSSISIEDEKRIRTAESLMQMKGLLMGKKANVSEEFDDLQETIRLREYSEDIFDHLDRIRNEVDEAFNAGLERLKVAQIEAMK